MDKDKWGFAQGADKGGRGRGLVGWIDTKEE